MPKNCQNFSVIEQSLPKLVEHIALENKTKIGIACKEPWFLIDIQRDAPYFAKIMAQDLLTLNQWLLKIVEIRLEMTRLVKRLCDRTIVNVANPINNARRETTRSSMNELRYPIAESLVAVGSRMDWTRFDSAAGS